MFQVYRASNIRVIKTINVKSYLTTAGKLSVRNPIVMLKESNHPPGISQDWLYVGKRHSNSFFHTDDFGLPVINTMLNDGRKLWIVIDPGDNRKIIQKLRSISGK